MRNTIPLAALTAVLLAAPALAQQTSTWVETKGDLPIAGWSITTEQAEDMDVVLADGTRVGEVEEIIGTDATTPGAVVIDVDDLPGVTEGDRIFPLDQLAVGQNQLTTTLTIAAIEALPRWQD